MDSCAIRLKVDVVLTRVRKFVRMSCIGNVARRDNGSCFCKRDPYLLEPRFGFAMKTHEPDEQTFIFLHVVLEVSCCDCEECFLCWCISMTTKKNKATIDDRMLQISDFMELMNMRSISASVCFAPFSRYSDIAWFMDMDSYLKYTLAHALTMHKIMRVE